MKADTIQLIPVGQPVGPLKWQMSMNGAPPQGQGNYPVVDVPVNVTDDITFTIRHPGSIKFAATDAFCAQEGTSKPKVCDTTVFTSSFDQQGNLVVHNANPKEATYTYVINFTEGTPQLDPIIKNGGTTIPPGGGLASYSTAITVLAIVALVALVALVARRMRNRSA